MPRGPRHAISEPQRKALRAWYFQRYPRPRHGMVWSTIQTPDKSVYCFWEPFQPFLSPWFIWTNHPNLLPPANRKLANSWGYIYSLTGNRLLSIKVELLLVISWLRKHTRSGPRSLNIQANPLLSLVKAGFLVLNNDITSRNGTYMGKLYHLM